MVTLQSSPAERHILAVSGGHSEGRKVTNSTTGASNIFELLASAEMPDGRGYGSTLSTGRLFIDFTMDNLVGDVKIFNPKAAIPDKGRSLIILAAHGGVLGPLPTMAALGRMYIDHGLGDQTIGFYTHRAIQLVPGMKTVFEKMGALYRVSDVEDLARRLKSGGVRIAGNALEGVSCMFSWTEFVGPFHTGGMIAAAIMSGASICLLTHQGADPWNLQVNLPFGMTVPKTRGLRGLNIPIAPIRRIEHLSVLCRRYRLRVKKSDFLSKMDRGERHIAIKREMETIRDRLNLMTAELKKMR